MQWTPWSNGGTGVNETLEKKIVCDYFTSPSYVQQAQKHLPYSRRLNLVTSIFISFCKKQRVLLMRIFVDTVLVLDNSTVGMSSFHSSQGLLLCVYVFVLPICQQKCMTILSVTFSQFIDIICTVLSVPCTSKTLC